MKSLMKVSTLIGLTLFTLVSTQISAQTQIIHAGKVLNVPGQAPLTKQTIVIKDGIITSLKSGFIPVNKIDKQAQLVSNRQSLY